MLAAGFYHQQFYVCSVLEMALQLNESRHIKCLPVSKISVNGRLRDCLFNISNCVILIKLQINSTTMLLVLYVGKQRVIFHHFPSITCNLLQAQLKEDRIVTVRMAALSTPVIHGSADLNETYLAT